MWQLEGNLELRSWEWGLGLTSQNFGQPLARVVGDPDWQIGGVGFAKGMGLPKNWLLGFLVFTGWGLALTLYSFLA